MPRKAPGPNNGVTEHRITLGDFERKQLVQSIDAYQADKIFENIPFLMMGMAAVGIAGVAAYVAYQIYNLIPNLFDTTNEQEGGLNWFLSNAGFGGQYDNFVKKEWRTFGIPLNAAQIEIQYSLNLENATRRLEKAKSAIELTKGAGFAGSFGAFAKIAATAQSYIDEGHAKSLEELEEWKLYYIDYFENNPPIQEESDSK